jgi:hypothetical protein
MFRGGAPLYIVRKERYMITEKTLMKFGFINDENCLRLKEFLKNNLKLKEIHIDIYPDNPLKSSTSFMLLLRTSEKNIIISNDGNRLILKKNDRYETHIMNVLFSKITECFFKVSDSCSEFILNVQNIFYRISVLN